MRPKWSVCGGEGQKVSRPRIRRCSGTLNANASAVVSNSPISRTGEDTCGKSTSSHGKRLKNISVALPPVQLVRPCKFCRAHYTKTPQLHSQNKCLPLLQLAYLQHHGRPGSIERGSQDVGNDLTDGPHVGRQADQGSASQVPQNQGAIRAAHGQEGMGAEVGPNTGASSAAPNHRPTRGSPATLGGGSQLDPVHGGRRARHHATTDADNSGVEKIPRTRNMQVRSATSAHGSSAHGAISPAAKAGSLHSGPAETLQSQTPQRRAFGMVAVPRTHRGLGGMAADKDKTTMFKLTLSMEGPKKQQIRDALTTLSDSAALRLIGARLRPERSHRQLPKELQAMIQDADL